MAGYGMVSPPPPQVAGFGNYAAAMSPTMPQYGQPQQQQIRPGTLPPGTCIKIGDYEVTIDRFLSEGGFAHVYLVRSSQPIPSPAGGSESYHVLKRVAAADKTILREIRWEVDVMKILRGHKYIVNLIEASASMIPGTTGYEVFILMEYCAGGGIIDMMNTRLQNRLTEQEILKIFSDVVEGVCWMHTRDPPLMHRDLKVENILRAGQNFYKLCDFGSTSVPKLKPAQSIQEIQELEMELNKHTTLQYRSPEMCDVWSRKGVGLPADIWALGVLLYKLCFYTTPFEEHGPLAILNVQYTMPSTPNYSVDMRNLIATMLVESASQRPTAWQVHKEVCRLRGVAPKSDYQTSPSQRLLSAGSPNANSGGRTVSPALPNLPLSRPSSGLGSIVNVASATQSQNQPVVSQEEMNGVSPMRRGRPGKNPVPSTSNLRSEWEVPSQGSASATITVGVGEQNGFGDSFAPTVPTIMPPSPSEHKNAEQAPEPIKQSKTALATAALFEELASPGSTTKTIPTLASLAAAKNGPNQQQQQQQIPSLPPKPSGLGYGAAPQQAGGFRRVSAGKPLGPRNLAGSSSPSPNLGQPASRMGLSPLHIENETTVIEPISAPEETEESRLPTKSNSAPADAETSQPLTAPSDEKPQIQKKPALVSRGSQTSPVLLSDWKKRDLLAQKSATLPVQPEVEERTASMDRFPSLDDWEGSSMPAQQGQSMLSPTLPPARNDTTGNSAVSGSGSIRAKQPSFDLMGDDPDGMGTAPIIAEPQASPRPSPALGTSTPVVATDTGSLDFSPFTLSRSPSTFSSTSSTAFSPPASNSNATSFSSFQGATSSSPFSSSSTSAKPDPPKDKFKPIKKDSPVVQRQVSNSSSVSTPSSSSGNQATEPESSDEEDVGPEDPSRQRYGRPNTNGQTTPTRSEPRLPSSTGQTDSAIAMAETANSTARPGSGNFDIKPALASIEKFAPRARGQSGSAAVPPPILAPKPSRAGISGLLSRYEGISGGFASSSCTTNGEKQAPPVKAPKPLPGSRNGTASSVEDDFATRYPALENPSSAMAVSEQKKAPLTPQSQTNNGKKELFKPSRENSSNSLASLAEGGRPRPKSMHFPSPTPASASAKPGQTVGGVGKEAEEEEEEKFQGVASMRDKWQKMGQQTSQSHSGATVGRRASTLGNGSGANSRWK